MTTTSRGRKFTSLTYSCGKKNRREHCKIFEKLDLCGSCLQLMTSQNTAIYWYHGIFETVNYRRTFPNTAHPYIAKFVYSYLRLECIISCEQAMHSDNTQVGLCNTHAGFMSQVTINLPSCKSAKLQSAVECTKPKLPISR